MCGPNPWYKIYLTLRISSWNINLSTLLFKIVFILPIAEEMKDVSKGAIFNLLLAQTLGVHMFENLGTLSNLGDSIPVIPCICLCNKTVYRNYHETRQKIHSFVFIWRHIRGWSAIHTQCGLRTCWKVTWVTEAMFPLDKAHDFRIRQKCFTYVQYFTYVQFMNVYL